VKRKTASFLARKGERSVNSFAKESERQHWLHGKELDNSFRNSGNSSKSFYRTLKKIDEKLARYKQLAQSAKNQKRSKYFQRLILDLTNLRNQLQKRKHDAMKSSQDYWDVGQY